MQSLQFINMFLMTFAIVALVVGSFVIYNTFSITVAQRTKENALLRAIGAKRKQVTRSVMLEALFTGVFASAIGVVVGIAHRAGSAAACCRRFGLELPAADTVVKLEHDRHLDGHRHRRDAGRGVPAGPQGGEGCADRGAARRRGREHEARRSVRAVFGIVVTRRRRGVHRAWA